MSETKEKTSKPRAAFKTRVHLNNVQAAWMRDNCVAGRLAYNYAVAFLRDAYFFPHPSEIRKWWSVERDTLHPWMVQRRLVMAGINDAINVNFASAMKRWKAARYSPDAAPKFHGRHHPLSITWNYTTLSNRHVDGRTLTLPQKMGVARLAEPLRFEGPIKQVTFSESGGKWYASFLTETVLPKPEPAPFFSAVGIDVGVVQFASRSDGVVHHPEADYKKEQAKLAKLQRQLSAMQGPVKRERKASKNWLKQKKRVAKQAARIANIRRNYTEHVSKAVAEQFETVVIEDLRIKNMTASAKGSAEAPGRNVNAKAGLNRAILNGGFFQFRSRLEAKVVARGGQVIAVPPHYTSQTCPACGHVAAENRPSQAVFECVECGYGGNADHIAAQNILHRGLTMA